MLTPELVRTRKSGKTLSLLALGAKERELALEVAELLLGHARSAIGSRRGDLQDALSTVVVASPKRKLRDGLVRLVEDALQVEEASELPPDMLRRELFSAAAEARRAAGFVEREALLERAAASRGVTVADIERALYADLKSEHRVLGVEPLDASELVERYERQSRQAVLLRAVRLVVEVTGGTGLSYRTLFAKLKFRRLLFRIEKIADGYRIEIDGPFSMFESVTRYGLALALVLPAIEAAGDVTLVADVLWGPRREALVYSHRTRRGESNDPAVPILDEARRIIDGLDRLAGPWRAAAASEVFDLPGLGVTAPDLVLLHEPSGGRVYVELMGFWSREAVFRRIELAEAGLPQKMVFAVSQRLRVSEELLDGVESASLYVYKGSVGVRALTERAQRILGCEERSS